MKKLILFIAIAISFISCGPKSAMTVDQYIENLNSFDSTATYKYSTPNGYNYTFVISYKDSLFVYEVEATAISREMYIHSNEGQPIK